MATREMERGPMETTANGHGSELTVEQALAVADPGVACLLEKSLSGAELNFRQGLRLAQTAGEDLIALVKTADELRRRAVGDRITYVVNRNINFTNICHVGCAFCGFSRGRNAPDAYKLSLDEIVEKARQACALGASEVCIQGGLARDLEGYFYRDILRALKSEFPRLHLHAFSPMEILYGIEKTRLPLSEYLSMLKAEGLGSIPGTAAEILDDEIRGQLSPNKLRVRQWVEIVRTAHRLGIPSTSTMMYGHVETPAHWVRHILLLREIQKETGGFTEFVPLSFVYEKTRLFRQGHARPGSTRRENLLVHALARLLLNGHIPNLQVSWVKMGFEESLACLEAGANDFGGTLMEENISKSAGATFGEYVAPEEFRALIRRIDREPAERTTTYALKQIFGARDEGRSAPLAPRSGPAGRKPHYSGTGY